MAAQADAGVAISPGIPSMSPTRRAGRIGLARREMLIGYAFLSPALILFLVFIAGPLLGAIGLSFYQWDLFSDRTFIGLQNYRALRDDEVARTAIRNSFYFAFWSIVLPVAKNSLITAGLFAFLFSWSDFLFALTLTTTDEVRPVTLGIYQYLGTQVSNWSAVMATAVLSSLPAIALLILAQKYIAAGATGGAVK